MSDPITKSPAELEREERIIGLAMDQYCGSDGDIDIDPDAVVSEGDDNGAYVAAWVWVSFAGEDGLDKEPVEPGEEAFAILRAGRHADQQQSGGEDKDDDFVRDMLI